MQTEFAKVICNLKKRDFTMLVEIYCNRKLMLKKFFTYCCFGIAIEFLMISFTFHSLFV